MGFRFSLSLIALLSACTGGQLVTPDGQTVTTPKTVTISTCSQTFTTQTDTTGQFKLNPYYASSSGFSQSQYVPEGLVRVRIDSHEYIFNHAFDSQCFIPYNNSYGLRPCSKDAFVLGAQAQPLVAPAGATVRYPTWEGTTCLFPPGTQQQADCLAAQLMSRIYRDRYWQTRCVLAGGIR